MNETLAKFNYPRSMIHDYTHWVVLIRPRQVTLGCLILAEKSSASSFGQLTREAMVEFAQVCRDTESALTSAFEFDKINYIALMMVDPNVHFHLIPRYAKPRQFEEIEFKDTGWPKHPDLQFSHDVTEFQLESIRKQLVDVWPTS